MTSKDALAHQKYMKDVLTLLNEYPNTGYDADQVTKISTKLKEGDGITIKAFFICGMKLDCEYYDMINVAHLAFKEPSMYMGDHPGFKTIFNKDGTSNSGGRRKSLRRKRRNSKKNTRQNRRKSVRRNRH